MRTIHKRTWPEYFEKVLSGEKTVELRLADFDVEVGDVLILEEWEPLTKEYTGREIRKEVTQAFHVMITNFWTSQAIRDCGVWLMQLGDQTSKVTGTPASKEEKTE